jgi:hypothetical protein
MKNLQKTLVGILAVCLLLISCGPSQKVTSSWKNPTFKAEKKYSKIFISSMSSNPKVKITLEDDMAAAAQSRGYQVVKSQDIFRPTFTKETSPDKDVMLAKIRELGCDLIFTVTLVDKQSETRYVPGATMYAPFPGYGYGYRGYYNYWSPMMYDPGYYTTDRTYFMEGDLFDVASENMIWSVQTESYNPSSIEKFSKDLTQLMLERAEKDLKMK